MLITAQSLGNDQFKQNYHIKYAYLTGSMYKGISSAELVVQLARNGLMGFFGTGGLKIEEIEKNLNAIRNSLSQDQYFGINLLSTPMRPNLERQLVDLYLKH